MSSTDVAQRILTLAQELGALAYGEFTLASGQKSGYYFDGRLLTLSPRGANLAAEALLPVIRAAGAAAVGGPAVAAVPLAAAIAMRSGQDGGAEVPAFFVRKETKDHGLGKRIEGPLPAGAPVAVVDDTCSTAGSLYEAIEAVEAAGHRVVLAACILDRAQGGSERLRKDGYAFHAVLVGDAQGRVSPA
jgi:orotate phosphoribosyltransferase